MGHLIVKRALGNSLGVEKIYQLLSIVLSKLLSQALDFSVFLLYNSIERILVVLNSVDDLFHNEYQ